MASLVSASIFENFCGSLCNCYPKSMDVRCGGCCSSTKIVIGELNIEGFNTDNLEAPLRDASKYVTSLENSEGAIEKRKMVLLNHENLDEYESEIRLGILEFTRKHAERLGNGAGMNTEEEGWLRLITACRLSEVDLESKYQSSEPLKFQEKRRIKKKVKLIEKQGTKAAYLWEKMKEHTPVNKQGLKSAMLLESLNKDVYRVFEKRNARNTNFLARICEASKFEELQIGDKEAFLKAAKHLHHVKLSYKSWNGEYIEDCTYSKDLKLDFKDPKGTPRCNLGSSSGTVFHSSTEFHKDKDVHFQEINEMSLSEEDSSDEETFTKSSEKKRVSSVAELIEEMKSSEYFIIKLGDIHMHTKDDQIEKKRELGIARLKALCLITDTDYQQFLDNPLTDNYQILRKFLPKFQQNSGAIYFLYQCLKSSIDKAEKDAFKYLNIDLKNYPDLMDYLQNTHRLMDLAPEAISSLFEISETFSDKKISDLQEEYPLELWMQKLEEYPLEFWMQEEKKEEMHYVKPGESPRAEIPTSISACSVSEIEADEHI